jgi:hypothetical protein
MLTLVQLVNEMFRFYGTRMCITVLTTATTEACQDAVEADVRVHKIFPYIQLSYHPEVNYILSSNWS